MITISIASDLADLFPSTRVGYFVATRRPHAPDADAAAQRLALDALASLRQRRFNVDHLAETAPFSSWRQAFSKGGLQPSKYRSSVESLTRRYMRHDQPVLTGNGIVDLYNAASVKHLVPMGAYDINSLPENTIALRLLDAQRDRFSPVGAEAGQFPMKHGIPVYGCGDEILCYGFNHRDSRLTACTETSDPILFVAEVVDDEMLASLRSGLDELKSVLAELHMETSKLSIVGRP